MFKNIIIGVDFSECSQNALQHAVSMAVNFKADLTLVHVISPDEKLVVESKENSDIITFAQERLEQYASQCRLVVTENEVRTKIRMGKPEREINAEANLLGDALITMGTHGCSGFEEFFVGSNTYKVVSRANCPVLTIRKDVDIHRDLTDISLVFRLRRIRKEIIRQLVLFLVRRKINCLWNMRCMESLTNFLSAVTSFIYQIASNSNANCKIY